MATLFVCFFNKPNTDFSALNVPLFLRETAFHKFVIAFGNVLISHVLDCSQVKVKG
jgi:hypothetical protein